MAYKRDTICVQGGYRPASGESRIPPIVQSTTFFYDSTQGMADLFDLKAEGYFYTRLSNPTVAAFEGKVAALEGGVAAIGCASGMSASTMMAFTLCGEGDNIVSSSAIYGGTFNLFAVTLPKLGIETRFFDPDAPAEEIEKLIDGKTKLVFTETVANPSIKILDFDKIAAICKKYGVLFAVDNTLATPILCRPIEWGANIVIHSSSKYLDGHAAALGGVIVDGGNFAFKDNPRYPAFNVPMKVTTDSCMPICCRTVCYQVPRADHPRHGRHHEPAKRLPQLAGVRYPRPAHGAAFFNAKKVAAYLAKHPRSIGYGTQVCPTTNIISLPKSICPTDRAGMLSFGIKGDVKKAATFMEALRLVTQENARRGRPQLRTAPRFHHPPPAHERGTGTGGRARKSRAPLRRHRKSGRYHCRSRTGAGKNLSVKLTYKRREPCLSSFPRIFPHFPRSNRKISSS